MTRLSLVTIGLRRKPARTALTVLSLAVAFVLFMLLRALSAAFAGGVSVPGTQRVIVDARYAMTDNLPLAAVRTIREMAGVAEATQMSWFGGYYRNPAHAFAKAPVDHARYFRVFPDLVIADDVLARFQASRRAAVVPDAMAREYDWRVGDLVPIVGDIWPKSDGSWDWEFEIAGTYGVPPASGLQPWFLLRYDYFNESVADWAKDQVGWVVARVDRGVDPKTVVDAVDRRFENSSDPTRSLSEDELSRQFANQLGDIGLIATLILAAVFFTMLLLTANVAALAFRERVPELAVMKTLGFTDGTVAAVVLGEALALCLAGAVGGVAIGFALESPLNAQLAGVVGRFEMSWIDGGLALAIAGGLGLTIGTPPAITARRLSIVRALREVAGC